MRMEMVSGMRAGGFLILVDTEVPACAEAVGCPWAARCRPMRRPDAVDPDRRSGRVGLPGAGDGARVVWNLIGMAPHLSAAWHRQGELNQGRHPPTLGRWRRDPAASHFTNLL